MCHTPYGHLGISLRADSVTAMLRPLHTAISVAALALALTACGSADTANADGAGATTGKTFSTKSPPLTLRVG